MTQLDQYYKPQVDAAQNQLNQLPAYQAAQQAGLDQAKTNAFGDITAGANAKGVLYSGIPIGEQAKYVGEKYLPAVAGLKQNIADKTFNLQDSIAKIRQSQAQQAYSTRQSQLQQEQSYALAQQKLNNQQQVAASRVSSAAPKAPSQQSIAGQIRSGLNTVRGRDGYVAPQDYAKAYQDWVQSGFTPASFNSTFKDLKNPQNGYYDYAISKSG